MFKIQIIPILNDNYAYFLQCNNKNIVVDPGEAQPIIDFLEKNQLSLDLILSTHHHADHIAGNDELKRKYRCSIAGPKAEQKRINTLDILLDENSDFDINEETVQIIQTPGHTSGHICFYFSKQKILFSGDTLFSMGCGRLFEGTPEQMWDSLNKLMKLPKETLIYCGHEYTLSNAEFCLKLEPENTDLLKRYAQIQELRCNNKPTLPVSLDTEMQTNIFLRAGSVEQFAKLRSLKDQG